MHQPEYWPPLRTVRKLALADHVVLLQGPGIMFDRSSCQHRARVRSVSPVGGWEWLTIPYAHTGELQALRDVRAANEEWPERHYQALRGRYRPAAGWAELFVQLGAFASVAIGRSVAGASRLALLSALAWLDCMPAVHLDTDFDGIPTDRTGRLVALCQALKATTYLSGATGARILDRAQFADAGIDVQVHAYTAPSEPDGVEPSVLHDLLTHGVAGTRARLALP